jgi:hypothetical protein
VSSPRLVSVLLGVKDTRPHFEEDNGATRKRAALFHWMLAALAAICFGLRRALRPLVRTGLCVADSLSEHLAKLSFGFRRCPRDARFLPLGHRQYVEYVGMESKPPRCGCLADGRAH